MTPKPFITLVSRPDLSSVSSLSSAIDSDWRADDHATPAELLIEYCGRLCYLSFGTRQSPKSNRQYITHLIKEGHESVLEHANWTFLATNVTRSFSHQLVRHRIGFSYSQLSQQYVDQNMVDLVDPELSDLDPIIAQEWNDIKKRTLRLYSALLNVNDNPSKEARRQAHSMARLVLPNAITTMISFTANARSLRHFLKLRGGIVGDHEMRRFSASLLEILLKEAPSVFQDFEVTLHPDGVPLVQHNPI
jgi:thymidylate synthase (FAD)